MVDDSDDSDDRTSIGVWVDKAFLDEFDALCKRREAGTYSRSGKIRDAMRLYQTVEDALDQADVTFDREVDKRNFVRQAVGRELRRDAEG